MIPSLLFLSGLSCNFGLPPFVGTCWLDMVAICCSSLDMVIGSDVRLVPPTEGIPRRECQNTAGDAKSECDGGVVV